MSLNVDDELRMAYMYVYVGYRIVLIALTHLNHPHQFHPPLLHMSTP